MINSIRLVNFKNFADETLKLGPFTVIVGANASGKSNIRDAFRFLHGIGRGYTLAEILGGKYGPGGQMEWEPIRGAPNEIVRFPKIYPYESASFSIQTELNLDGKNVFYWIKVGFNPNTGFVVLEEELQTESGPIYINGETDADNLSLIIGDSGTALRGASRPQPALRQLRNHLVHYVGYDPHVGFLGEQGDLPAVEGALFAMEKSRFLEPSPERMREPSIPGATMLGDSGENLPSVLESICADPTRERNLMSWLQEFTPMDVKDFDFPRDPSGRIHLQIVERNGRKVSAYSASDGTLRFLGILAALLGPNAGGLYFFEEIDNGIHPNRLWLLLDLIEQQTAEGNIQVVTTTHSPAMLAWMSDTAFESTSIVYRDQYWADSVIRPIAGLYNLRELRESQGIERLLTSGWFETAMKYSEGEPDSDYLDSDEDDWEQGVLQ